MDRHRVKNRFIFIFRCHAEDFSRNSNCLPDKYDNNLQYVAWQYIMFRN